MVRRSQTMLPTIRSENQITNASSMMLRNQKYASAPQFYTSKGGIVAVGIKPPARRISQVRLARLKRNHETEIASEVARLDEWDPEEAAHFAAKRRKRQKKDAATAARKAAYSAVWAAHAALLANERAQTLVDYAKNVRKTQEAVAPAIEAARLAALDANNFSEWAIEAWLAARARRDAQISAKSSAEAAALAVCAMENLLQAIKETEKLIWEIEQKLLKKQLQELVELKIGDKCPDVKVNLIQNTVDLLAPLNFLGGKADVVEEDLPLLQQIVTAIMAIYYCVDGVNDHLEEQGRPRSFKMLHLRVDGHVHKGKKSTVESCEKISQERAEKIVATNVHAGVPRRYMHPKGFGASCPDPSGSAELNRRVEIHVMDEEELTNFIQWKLKTYDADGGGYLDRAEVTAMALGMGRTKKGIAALFEEMDSDGSEHISLHELTAWFLSS
jgi:hypothetical protein